MKVKILITALFIVQLAFVISLNAAKNIETKLTVKTDLGETEDRLAFGTNVNAHFWLDENLGETDLPPPPPSGLFPVFFFTNEDSSYAVTSYKDFQPPVAFDGQSRTFSLRVYRDAGAQVFFEWEEMDIRIDSAYLVDASTGGLSIKVDMKENTSAEGNVFLENYKIIAWYNFDPSNIANDNKSKAGLSVSPNPVKETAYLKTSLRGCSYAVYGSCGKILMKGSTEDKIKEINTSGLAPGVYFVRILSGRKVFTEKFIKY